MRSAQDIFKIRGGIRIAGGYLCHCWGPIHKRGDRNPSLQVSDNPGKLPGLFCHTGCEWKDLVSHPIMQGTISNIQSSDRHGTFFLENGNNRIPEWQKAYITETILGSEDIRNTVAQDYLEHQRGLTGVIDEELALTCRFKPNAKFKSDGVLETAPAIVSIMRPFTQIMQEAFGPYFDQPNDAVNLMRRQDLWQAIHRIRLCRNGKKVWRGMLGPAKGAVIFLSCPIMAAYRQVITVAEGLETALSAKKRGFQGVIAAGSSGAIASLPYIDGVREIFLCVETDVASRKAIEKCGNAWHHAGAKVRLVEPSEGAGDLNDEDREVYS